MSRTTITALSITTLIACLLILAIYYLNTGRIAPRLHYAVMMSMVPALVTLAVTWWKGLRTRAVVVIYVVFFLGLQVLWFGFYG
jgi:glucose-6-phosphate dehydrogenase assembly protein OpcA